MKDKDWNYDRIINAQAMMNAVEVDIMRTLHKGEVGSSVRNRIVTHLRNAADELERMEVKGV
jgi:hypothetical protein